LKSDSHEIFRPNDAPPSADDSDLACARRAQEGERRAIEELVLRHQDAIARLLWRFARSKADLDDLVQETFLRMVRGLPQWRSEQPFLHWLMRIATNTGRDYFRRQRVRHRYFADSVPEANDGETRPGPEAVDPAGDPVARAAANEVKDLLRALPPNERALLTLHHLEGWKLREVARHFGWTLTATKLRAWRARRHLLTLFKHSDLP
jgi:RNA polymerase sigma-70 factor (ECF subfamily)